MGLTVTLSGARYTDGSEGRVALLPRSPWMVSSGVVNLSPTPFYFKITSSGTLQTLTNESADIVATYDSSENLDFTPEGSSYIVTISIAGQEVVEYWTVDGAEDTVDWATLGIKASPSDLITYPLPLTVDSPVRTVATEDDLPDGLDPGIIYYVTDTDSWWGNKLGGWEEL
jgi:hypothetical protein